MLKIFFFNYYYRTIWNAIIIGIRVTSVTNVIIVCIFLT
jgi:hypothetical protein